jgi:hypothetical protein
MPSRNLAEEILSWHDNYSQSSTYLLGMLRVIENI